MTLPSIISGSNKKYLIVMKWISFHALMLSVVLDKIMINLRAVIMLLKLYIKPPMVVTEDRDRTIQTHYCSPFLFLLLFQKRASAIGYSPYYLIKL